jgi:hypothetical protein
MSERASSIQTGYSGLTSADIEKSLGRSFTSLEAERAQELIEEIEAELVGRCGRNFAFQTSGNTPTSIEYYQSMNSGITDFYPHNIPIDEVIEIEVGGTVVYEKDGVSNTLILGTDFVVYEHKVHFINPTYYAVSTNAMKITYTIQQFWGKDVIHLIKRWVAALFLAADSAGVPITRHSFSSSSEDFDDKELERKITEVVNRYANADL